MTKTWRCYSIKVCGLSWVTRTGFSERCCSNVSLTSSCSTMEWRQTSEQLIAPELAPQQSINSTTEENYGFFLYLAADCPFNFIITLCCCTLTFQLHDFLSVGSHEAEASVCERRSRSEVSLLWLDVSAGFGLVDSVACEHFTSCSNSAMQYWAKHTCREGQSF